MKKERKEEDRKKESAVRYRRTDNIWVDDRWVEGNFIERKKR